MMNQQNNQNIFNYHEVFANSIAIIQDLLKMGNRTEEAKKMILFNYLYAVALNDENYSREKIEELKKKDIYELLFLMCHAQKKVGLIPMQDNARDSYYTRIIKKIRKDGVGP